MSVLLEENQMSGVIGWATEINLGIPTGVSKRDKTPLKKIKVFITLHSFSPKVKILS